LRRLAETDQFWFKSVMACRASRLEVIWVLIEPTDDFLRSKLSLAIKAIHNCLFALLASFKQGVILGAHYYL